MIVLIVLPLSMGSFLVISEQPGFCNSCHIMNPYYDSWQRSTHSEVNCLECHMQPGFVGHIKGKINGLAQAVDCMVGRVGTKPNGTVTDSSCLRSGCHSIEELEEPLQIKEGNKFKFTHKGHIGETIAGITISCGVCHSHFEGEEHFGINTQACFTCHFLRSKESVTGRVKIDCQSCHDAPTEPIQRGRVKIDHQELISYEVSCEESCHKKQIEIPSTINENTCLNCHNYSLTEKDLSINEIHELHSESPHKIECFACHGKVSHKASEGTTVSAMLDCQNCHSNTHEVQRTIYSARQGHDIEQNGKVLSPMFMVHVECKGCHIEQTQAKPGVLNSLGTISKAVPQACDHCHEEGTGQRYIPFWQNQTKRLYEKIKSRVDRYEERAVIEPDKELAQEMVDKSKKARVLLDAVVLDGSWGVHNLKYTEMMLLKAKDIINGTK